MLEIRQVCKRFGGIVALERVSLNARSGEIVAVVGANGSGKSTLLGIVAGVLAPSAGSVRVGGMNVRTRAPQVRRQLAYLPEHCPLYGDLRVVEHLNYRGKLKGLVRKRLRARLRSVIDVCGLGEVQQTLIGRLSAGQRQRVGLADALLTEPHLLVLDEPFAGLDPEQAARICTLLTSSLRHSAILLATHRLDLAGRICHRCTALFHGRVAGTLEVNSNDGGPSLEDRLRTLWHACEESAEAGEGA